VTAFVVTMLLCLGYVVVWEIQFAKKRRAFLRALEEQNRQFEAAFRELEQDCIRAAKEREAQR
jgi:hypothetical protein